MTSIWNRKIFILLLFLLSTVISFFLFYLISSYPHILNSSYIPQTPQIPQIPQPSALPTLSAKQIFFSDHTFLSQFPPDRLRTLITTGDVIPARSVNAQSIRKNNFLWPWEKTADFLKNADITFINLETPLIKNCPLTDTGMTFCGNIRHIEGLKYAGIDIVNLANNHAGNYGEKGAEETVSLLNEAGILVTGNSINSSTPGESAATPGVSYGSTIMSVRGLRFAFLGFHELEHDSDYDLWKEKAVEQIKEAKKNADVTIVAYHWGWEYTNQPNNRQMELAHLAIDNGADLIIGNHPHWIQPVEIYKDKLIVYAHGNFIFDQMWSEKTRAGIVGRYTFYDDKLVDVQFSPIYIKDYGQPEFLEGERKIKILEEMEKGSTDLSSFTK